MPFVIRHPDIDGTAVITERALPHYANRGWLLEDRTAEEAPTAGRPVLEKPNRSDSAAKWKTYAVATGMAFDDAMAATRDELADKYSPQPDPAPEPSPKSAPAAKPKES